jgi:hypothetical protein
MRRPGVSRKPSATAQRAIELARTSDQPELAARNAELLELYRAGQPYRETLPEK